MKVGFRLLFFAAGAVWADIAGECDMVGFYQELGCIATSQVSKNTGCPEVFKCPDLHPNPKKCFYRGAPYNARDVIPQSLVNNPCSQACMCNIGTEASFQCAAVDCVETFNTDMEQCVYTYDLESCCYTGTVCGKDDIAKLKICEVDGKRYKEGEKFYPKNTRKSCLCSADWNGSTDDVTYCTDINCGIEIHYQNDIMNRCAPVFLGSSAGTCPIGFQCPTNTSKMIRGINTRNISSQCVFGNMTLTAGDEVTVGEKCLKCSCEVPPFVTCTSEAACET